MIRTAVFIGVVVPFLLGPALLVAVVVWRLVLRSKPFGLLGGVLLFVASGASSCIMYGHGEFGTALLLFPFDDADRVRYVLVWMLATGMLVTAPFVVWSSWKRLRTTDRQSDD